MPTAVGQWRITERQLAAEQQLLAVEGHPPAEVEQQRRIVVGHLPAVAGRQRRIAVDHLPAEVEQWRIAEGRLLATPVVVVTPPAARAEGGNPTGNLGAGFLAQHS